MIDCLADTLPKITNRVIAAAWGSSNKGSVKFTTTRGIYATCGIYDVEVDTTSVTPQMGTGIEVIDQRPVILGSKGVDGSRVLGTLLEVETSTGTPSFSKPPLEPGGNIGCFAIRTKTDFTSDDATHSKPHLESFSFFPSCLAKISFGNFGPSVTQLSHALVCTLSYQDILEKFVVGLGSTLRKRVGPHIIFVPEPGELYQIKPSTSFYVVIGDFDQGDILTPEALKSSPGACKIDFANRPNNEAAINHEDHKLIVVGD